MNIETLEGAKATEGVAEPDIKIVPVDKRKVFIAMPIYGAIDPQFFLCCLKTVQEFSQGGLHGSIKPNIGDSAVGRSRNTLTRQFLESDCSHILFIDSDLVFSGEQIRRIMAHDEPIVGGLYCKKQEGPVQLVLNSLKPEECSSMNSRGLLQVKYIGTGFLRVSREVFQRMIEVYEDDIRYQCDHNNKITEYDFWQMGVYKYPDGTKRWLSEDWYFCQRALDLGFKVYADMAIICRHSGNVTYPLGYQERQLFPKIWGKLECPEDCRPGIEQVFSDRQYDFGIEFETPPKVCDIGANCGAFARWAQMQWPGSHVTCYEPNPDLIPFLKLNCKQDCDIVESAVASPDNNQLFIGMENRLISSVFKDESRQREPIQVHVTNPADIRGYDLVKIDTEGAELEIVRGLEELPTYLIVEYHSEDNRNEIKAALVGRMILTNEKPDGPGYGIMAFRKV